VVHGGLARRRLGVGSLIFFTVSASAPMTVLVGGIVITFAVTGVVGTPLAFPILAVALALFAVGYAAMSRYVFNAGAFYAYLAQGLGRAWGVAGSFIAVVAYNAIQIGLYGLFGFFMADFATRHWSLTWAWYVWALIAWAIVGTFGILRIDLNAKVLSVLLILEVLAVVLFDIGAFGHPAGGSVSTSALAPHNFFVSGIGGAFAFAVASFVGFESGATYSEEVKDPRHTVARATYWAVAITGVLYAVTAWALTVATGPDHIVDQARDPASGIPFSIVQADWNTGIADTANVLLLTSIFAALLSFHNGVARYLFALGRERVLPPLLGRTGRGTGAPAAGSVVQSLLAAAVIAIFAVRHLDPLLKLFTWFSYVAAAGVLVLMAGTSIAVVGFFRTRDTVETVWQRAIAPVLATVALIVITVVVVVNADSMLGTDTKSPLVYVLPGLIGAAGVVGLAWGFILRVAKPDVYEGIGRGGIERTDTVQPSRIGVGV
jgi:amino acid transporter